MIIWKQGDLFKSECQTLVNTVNVVGVMGKGIALEFKKRFPDMFKAYKIHCDDKSFTVDKLWLYKGNLTWILCFPTKEHWRNPSKIEWIESNLKKFTENYQRLGIKSIAFPKLGCNNGGLNWQTQVKPLIIQYLNNLTDITIEVYE